MSDGSLAESAMGTAKEAKDMASSAMMAIQIHTAECNERQKRIIEKLDEGKADRAAMRLDVKTENADLHKRVSDVAREMRDSSTRLLWWIVGVLVIGTFGLIGTVWWLVTHYAFVQPPA